MAAHLLEQTLPVAQARLAAYYQRAPVPTSDNASAFHATFAEVRRDLDPKMAELLGLSSERALTQEEIANLLAGSRTDGAPIPGKQIQRETMSLGDELGLRTDRLPTQSEVARVLAGCRADSGEPLPDTRSQTLRSRFLALYGATGALGGTAPSPVSLDHMERGRRQDGTPIRLGQFLDAISATRARIGYIDFCWSADKSASVAWATAPTEAERNAIASAHKEAVASVMRYVEAQIGRARKGKAGRDGYDSGSLAWISFDHYTSRPTVEIAREDAITGEQYTELVILRVAGDPQLHTHVCVPSAVVAGGRVVSPDLRQLKGRVHELGRLYQAFLATNLRRLGVDVVLDVKTGAARVNAIPESVREAFSKRTMNGTAAARAYAKECGLDWDTLDDSRKIALAKRGVQGDPRQPKRDDIGDWVAWQHEIANLGWQPKSILQLDAPDRPPERTRRLEHAYRVALEIFDETLRRQAVVDEADLRVAAATGLVASGIEEAADIDEIVKLFSTRGAIHDGKAVKLIWGSRTDAQGNEYMRITSTLHADREAELIALAKAAAADRSCALTAAEIDAAVARSNVDFEATEHGKTQHAIMHKLGQGGRLSIAIGVAGSGKSTLIRPLVSAWQDRVVWGAALAWRQSDDLVAAGIAEERCVALSVLLDRVRSGKVRLDRNSVVVLEELGQVGVKMLLDLLRLQAKYKFQIVGVGDPLQCRSIEAGPSIELLRRALGADAVPEILTTVRQQSERERSTTLLFREGRAAEALAIKREDQTARLVAGNYDQVVAAIADLWLERSTANSHDPKYTLSVTAPTNPDARAIASAIRERRRATGSLGPNQVLLSACDQLGNAFELPLAIGDRVRLFSRTNASYSDRSRGLIGNNGSILEVLSIGKDGMMLRNRLGRAGLVAWDTLRHPESGRIRLMYGDVLTIDSAQGLTSTEHIQAMPAGSSAVNGFKAYTASSRHRRTTYILCSEGAERREIVTRRPLGDTRRISDTDVWVNIGRNLSRQPEQESALTFMERAHQVRRESVTAFQIAAYRLENSIAKKTITLGRRRYRRSATTAIALIAKHLGRWLHEREPLIATFCRAAAGIAHLVADIEAGTPQDLQLIIGRIRRDPARPDGSSVPDGSTLKARPRHLRRRPKPAYRL